MDITSSLAQLSVLNASSNLGGAIGTKLLAQSLDQQKQDGAAAVELLNQSAAPAVPANALGGLLDIYA
jgi:hypothetical protein